MAFLVDSQDAGQDAAGQVVHPLAPLSAEEIEAASAAVKESEGLKDSARFVYISLYEPNGRPTKPSSSCRKPKCRATSA